jgi:NAD(P)-dependent dehydrogenase (short-subunit alcohol dehydrogenase family)
MFRLDSKVAIVTGAARGMGAAATQTLAQQGARVAAADLEFADSTAKSSAPPAVKQYRVDVSSVEQVRTFVESVVADFGRIDVLVNNAGICPRIPFEESTEADWERLMGVNAKSQYFLCQAVVPVMRKQGAGGRIINMASTGGRVGGFANSSIYSGTKGAIVMFTKSIAREVAKDGILVNCIAPGIIDTDMMRNVSEERRVALCAQVPLNRLGRPEEVANVVAFLASDECSYVTGATFDVNGGWVML